MQLLGSGLQCSALPRNVLHNTKIGRDRTMLGLSMHA